MPKLRNDDPVETAVERCANLTIAYFFEADETRAAELEAQSGADVCCCCARDACAATRADQLIHGEHSCSTGLRRRVRRACRLARSQVALCSAGTALRCAEDESVRPWSHLNGFKFPSSAKCDRDGPAEDQDGAYVKPPLDRRA